MNLKGLFQDFNPSKFLVYTAAFVFSILLELRLDGYLLLSYWVIFAPIWVWKIIVIAGAASGTIIWVFHPEYRREDSVDLHAMLISAFFQLLLFVFELLLCGNLEGYSMIHFRLIFIPLYCLSSFSVAACIWGFRHDRSLELETFFSVNILQLICISLKLDNVITWKWVVVFVPLWIVLTLISVTVLYYVIWVALFLRSPEITPRQRRGHIIFGTLSCCMVFPLLLFCVGLSRKLDKTRSPTYAAIFVPLQLSLISLIATSFYQKGGNPWWFGIRKDFCEYLLESCPCLKEYGNVSYKFTDTLAPMVDETSLGRSTKTTTKLDLSNMHNSQDCIEMPD